MEVAEWIHAVDEDDVAVAVKAPVLETVVKEKDIRAKGYRLFRRHLPVFSDKDGDRWKAERHHVRLIPCFLLADENRLSVRYDAALFLKSALVAAADDSRLLSLFKKELGNHQDAGRLPRAAGRNIADADDGNPRLDRIGRFPGASFPDAL